MTPRRKFATAVGVVGVLCAVAIVLTAEATVATAAGALFGVSQLVFVAEQLRLARRERDVGPFIHPPGG
jgi:hypothetical protein